MCYLFPKIFLYSSRPTKKELVGSAGPKGRYMGKLSLEDRGVENRGNKDHISVS